MGEGKVTDNKVIANHLRDLAQRIEASPQPVRLATCSTNADVMEIGMFGARHKKTTGWLTVNITIEFLEA